MGFTVGIVFFVMARCEAQPRIDKDKADETHFSAFQPGSEASSWFPRSQSDRWWPQYPSRTPRQGSQQALRLSRAVCSWLGKERMKASMKTRKDFLAAARAEKWVGPVMLVQQRDREDASPEIRVGFTASKKVGNSVARNRAKRRLRAISAELLPASAREGHDYVWIAKRGAVKAPFWKLRRDATRALERLTAAQPSRVSVPASDTPAESPRAAPPDPSTRQADAS